MLHRIAQQPGSKQRTTDISSGSGSIGSAVYDPKAIFMSIPWIAAWAVLLA
jgi:hypothetical protein